MKNDICQDSPGAVECTGIETVNSGFIYPCKSEINVQLYREARGKIIFSSFF